MRKWTRRLMLRVRVHTYTLLSSTAHLCSPLSVSEAASSAKHTDEYIQSLIDASLALYSADRIGMFDFALWSAGGNVEDSSPIYDSLKMSTSVFGVTLPFSLAKITPLVILKVY